jgi:hypothetical protein
MWNWLWHKRSGREAPPPHARIEPAPTQSIAAMPAVDADLGFVAWLIDLRPASDSPLGEGERMALATIDELIDGTRGVSDLLPRAPAVIPQLLSAMRQRDPSVRALVERVSKDLTLVAQVMQTARSAAYRGQGEVRDLAHAISVIGEHGLQMAIARVVLRPLLQAGGGALSAQAAPRLWEHTEHKSQLCSMKAAAAGLDPFDGCLAGMMHSAGWTAALRQLDRGAMLGRPWSCAFVEQLAARRDPLFGRVVAAWQVSPAVTALAEEAVAPGLGTAGSTLARLLLESDREATARVLSPLPSAAETAPSRVEIGSTH